MGTCLTKRLLKSGHTVKIADKRKSVTYPELWLRCDVRNSGNETKEFPASLTDEAMAPGADKTAKESQPMHSLLEVLKGSDVLTATRHWANQRQNSCIFRMLLHISAGFALIFWRLSFIKNLQSIKSG